MELSKEKEKQQPIGKYVVAHSEGAYASSFQTIETAEAYAESLKLPKHAVILIFATIHDEWLLVKEIIVKDNNQC